ncbi:HD domain-containing protein [Phycicoccus sp. BSK3Z-2]|uniref:HD domain-containing protein n=1 Tax=Phycicoccus avicenniae TaxID=2828860 RepID=A0A941I168_9MICO|nr:HD domain-containing phosphohydrolase [Phycicoccus avicenniae]MBR7743779.1 HD domain-containing protein [Phycicoccus avicenniae]
MIDLVVRRRDQLFATLVIVLGAGLVLWSFAADRADLGTLVSTHSVTLLVFVAVITAGELLTLRMPSGREIAPLATAGALSLAVVGPVADQPVFDVSPGLVVLVAATAFVVSGLLRAARGLPVGVALMAANLCGVAVAAVLARTWQVGGQTLWEDQSDPAVHQGVVAGGMVLVSAVGLTLGLVLVSAVRAERFGTPWLSALRDEVSEAAPLTLAVVVTGPMVALMAPVIGVLALPAALGPLAMAYTAVRQYARNRAMNRRLVGTLSRLTEAGGYTRHHHAERVAGISVRIGRILGLGERELRSLEYAALLHDLGQITLTDPIPDGATVLAAPADQRDIAAEGARIIRQADTLEDVAALVDDQTTSYRFVREFGEPVPMPSRIIKCANAFDDLTGGSDDPAVVAAAMERIHLGLGYEYDPDVVDALTRVAQDASAGRVAEQRAGAG